MDEYLRKTSIPQLEEILTKYGKISGLWFDTSYDMGRRRADMVRAVLKLQPGIIIINECLGGDCPGDAASPEGSIPSNGVPGHYHLTIDSTNGDPMPSGGLDYSGAGDLIVTGSGSVTLSGTNMHMGGTTVSGGTLVIIAASVVPGDAVAGVRVSAYRRRKILFRHRRPHEDHSVRRRVIELHLPLNRLRGGRHNPQRRRFRPIADFDLLASDFGMRKPEPFRQVNGQHVGIAGNDRASAP